MTLDVATSAEAQTELENILADVRRGIWREPATADVVEAVEEPTLHVLASEWVERRRHEVDARTVEHWRWALSNHLLQFFADYRPSEITVAAVEKFKTAKLAERERRIAAIEEWWKEDPKARGRMPVRPLSNASINKCLKVLAQVLDEAVELGYTDTNVARGKRRRLKADKPKRTWLELHEVQALLAAAGKHRPLIATMILAGLRVGELCSIRWRDVDLAGGKLAVADSKTDAGRRVVAVTPMLLDELKLHRADSKQTGSDDLVFGTSRGTPRNRSNITRQILQPAIDRANIELARAGRTPIEHVTNHSLRRTFCALMYEAGATPAYVMAQMGHTDASLALEVYSKVMERKRDTGERMDALVRGADWAQVGTNGAEAVEPTSVLATENPAGAGLF
ncbi:MAG TPA: tyrosine-type recombinase/integrase [Gaiellaceae bacterium]|nr:tyrosine-type recombinase/integrase [Gaiellaceae bacterium]